MSRTAVSFSVLLLFFLILSIYFYGLKSIYNQKSPYPKIFNTKVKGKSIKIDKFESFYLKKAVRLDFDPSKIAKKPIKVAIIPHHLLPYFIHADFFNRMAMQKPQSIILFGPNHPNTGDYKVITTSKNWQSAYGSSNSNKKLTNTLESKLGWVGEEERIISNEHSITNLLPYFHYFLPHSSVTTFILKPDISKQNIIDLYQNLKLFVSDRTVVVFSIDFSHYLTSYKAIENDAETLKALKNNDYDTILGMSNDNVDSPESLALFLAFAENRFNESCEVLENTNSGEVVNDPYKSTTSYFYIVCY